MAPNSNMPDIESANARDMRLHGILMVVAFGVLIPLAIICSRYLKEALETWWLRIHITLVSLATICIITSISIVRNAVSSDAMYLVTQSTKDGKSYGPRMTGIHPMIGYGIILGITAQIVIGVFIHSQHNPDLSRAPWHDKFHGDVGRAIVIASAVNIPVGIYLAQRLGVVSQSPYYFVAWFIWVAIVGVVVVWCQSRYGVPSRYIEGNVFVAAGAMGAKNLFSLPASERHKSIQNATFDGFAFEKNLESGPDYDQEYKDGIRNSMVIKYPGITFSHGADGGASPYVMSPMHTRSMWKTGPSSKSASSQGKPDPDEPSTKSRQVQTPPSQARVKNRNSLTSQSSLPPAISIPERSRMAASPLAGEPAMSAYEDAPESANVDENELFINDNDGGESGVTIGGLKAKSRRTATPFSKEGRQGAGSDTVSPLGRPQSLKRPATAKKVSGPVNVFSKIAASPHNAFMRRSTSQNDVARIMNQQQTPPNPPQ